MDIQQLRQKIIKKYGSIHNFCKQNEKLTRATVYLVFAEKYAGNVQKQIMKIENILDNSPDFQRKVSLSQQEIIKVLQETKCNNCRLLKPNCLECKRKNLTEAKAVYEFIQTKI